MKTIAPIRYVQSILWWFPFLCLVAYGKFYFYTYKSIRRSLCHSSFSCGKWKCIRIIIIRCRLLRLTYGIEEMKSCTVYTRCRRILRGVSFAFVFGVFFHCCARYSHDSNLCLNKTMATGAGMKLQLHQQRQQQCQRYQAAIKAKMRTNFRPRLAIKQPLYANAPCNNVNYLAFHFSLAFSFVPQIKLIFLLFILCRPHTYFHAHAHAYTTTCTQWNNLNLSF